MSRFEGDVTAWFHGPAEVLNELPAVAEAWLEALPKDYSSKEARRDVGEIVRQLRDGAPGNGEAVETLEIEIFSEVADVPLNCIDGIAVARPELEIAVAATLSHSIGGGEGHYTWFSPAGSPTLCPDQKKRKKLGSLVDHAHYCGVSAQLPITAVDIRRKSHTFDLYRTAEDQFAEGLSEMRLDSCDLWLRLEEAGEGGLEIMLDEGIAFLFQLSPQGTWRILNGELNWWKDCGTPEARLAAVQARVLDQEVRREDRPKGPRFLDGAGNEYFFWDQMKVGKLSYDIDWRFPTDAAWIPFP